MNIRLTADILIRLGTNKLLTFLEMSRNELLTMMVTEGCVTLELLAEMLSETTVLCECCGDDYAFIDDGICMHCQVEPRPRRHWLEEMIYC
jgi:hypothetical protein